MSKTISGTYSNGYVLTGGSQGILNPVSVTGSIAIGTATTPGALYAEGPNGWTVTNQGSITGGTVAGIELAAGGTVANNRPGYLSGHLGIAVLGSAGGVTNSGTIFAVNAGTSASADQAIGVLLSAGGSVTNSATGQITGQGAGVDILGGAGTVLNNGSIAGVVYDGVYLASGTVTNATAAAITGGSIGGGGSVGAGGSIVTSGWGVVIRNGGSLFNAGMVTGSGQGGAFLGGGYASNQGTIAGTWGIAISGGPGTVVNSGSLNGTVQSGVFLTGGTVTNTSGGQISGVSGVVIRSAAGTVANSGIILATSLTGYAVYLPGGFANRLIANPGATFLGTVTGGNTIGAAAVSTLELGSGASAGILSGLGSQFVDFGKVAVDAGASWSLNGTDSIAPGQTLSNQGSLAVNGALRVTGTLNSEGAMTVASTAGIGASATVDGTGAAWTLGNELVAGNLGTADVVVDAGATLAAMTAGTLPAMALGAEAGGAGTLVVTGTGAQALLEGQLNVGQAGAGTLLVENAGLVSTGDNVGPDPYQGVDIAQLAGGSGNATVTGANSALFNTGRFVVGDQGAGSLSILAGGTVNTNPGVAAGAPAGAVIANAAGASGSFTDVSGAGSDWRVTGLLDVGVSGSGALSISEGATVTALSLDSGVISSAVASIDVTDAGFVVSGNATVADDGTGVMSVLSGATFSAANLTIGSQGDSSGAVIVSGSGSVVDISGDLNVGTSLGTGDLTIGPGAAVNASVVNLRGEVVLENGELDPSVTLINQGQTAGGSGTIAAGDIVDEGVIQAGGSKPSQKLLVVSGTILGGGPWTINGSAQARANGGVGILQINAGGTLDLTGPVVNAGSTAFTDDVTPQSTYTVNESVVDVNFEDATGVLKLDDISGFSGTVVAFRKGDEFVITGGTLSNLGVSGGTTLTVADSGHGGTDRIIFGSAVSTSGFSIVNSNTIQVACFAAGTRIATTIGPVTVENLCIGDRVVTHEGSDEPIVLIKQRMVNCRAHPEPETVCPVRIRAGAFGKNVPVRDLYLSPDHAVFVNGVLLPVKLLINGTSIVQVKRARVIYFHVELPRHAVILAEELTVESYLDAGDRANVGQDDTVIRLFPDFAARLRPDIAAVWETRGVAPLVVAGAALAKARHLIASRVSRQACRSGARVASGGPRVASVFG